MVRRRDLLPERGEGCALEDVLSRDCWVLVFDEAEGLPPVALAEVVDDQVGPRLRDRVQQRGHHPQSVLSVLEHADVVPEDVVLLHQVFAAEQPLKRPQLRLSRPTIVELVVAAGLEVDCNHRFWLAAEVDLQHLERHIEDIQLVGGQGGVHVQRGELPVLQEEPLVNVHRVLVVRPQVLDGGQAELVLDAVPEAFRRRPLVIPHHPGLVVQFVCHVEEQSHLEAGTGAISPVRLILGLIVVVKRVQAARLVDVNDGVRAGLPAKRVVDT